MSMKINNVSDEAVKKATGKNWEEWFAELEQFEPSFDHKTVAKKLEAEHGLSSWWSQNVTVGYEKAKGKRILGETMDAGFQIGVQKTLPIEANKAWKFLLSDKILPLWLGVAKLSLEKGAKFESDSVTGEIRSVATGKKIRFALKSSDNGNQTTLQVYVIPAGKKTSIRFHQERLLNSSERDRMKNHWQMVLRKLEAELVTK